MSSHRSILPPSPARPVMLAMLAVAITACGRHDAPLNDTTAVIRAAPADAQGQPGRAASTNAPVRGMITSVTDSSITVATAGGEQEIRIVRPLRIYMRTASDLAHVTPKSFVGITSVAQPDGSQRATEIHVFPEELRGTGEGSRMIEQAAGNGARSTMTNGTVSPSRMTNGSVAGSRMTNGTVGTTSAGTSMTVEYKEGTQTIVIPPAVPVTIIGPTQTTLSAGTNVLVVIRKGADGRPATSTVMLAGAPAKK